MRVLAMFPYESVWSKNTYFKVDRDDVMQELQRSLANANGSSYMDNKQAFCIETDDQPVFILFHDNLVYFCKELIVRKDQANRIHWYADEITNNYISDNLLLQ